MHTLFIFFFFNTSTIHSCIRRLQFLRCTYVQHNLVIHNRNNIMTFVYFCYRLKLFPIILHCTWIPISNYISYFCISFVLLFSIFVLFVFCNHSPRRLLLVLHLYQANRASLFLSSRQLLYLDHIFALFTYIYFIIF